TSASTMLVAAVYCACSRRRTGGPSTLAAAVKPAGASSVAPCATASSSSCTLSVSTSVLQKLDLRRRVGLLPEPHRIRRGGRLVPHRVVRREAVLGNVRLRRAREYRSARWNHRCLPYDAEARSVRYRGSLQHYTGKSAKTDHGT